MMFDMAGYGWHSHQWVNENYILVQILPNLILTLETVVTHLDFIKAFSF